MLASFLLVPGVLLSLARADVASGAIAAPCQVTTPSFSQPAEGAAGVPVDVKPAVFFTTGACGGGEWILTLATTEDSAQVATVTGAPVDGFLELDPGADLEADTDFTLTIASADGSVESSVISFSTGADATEPVGIVPEILHLAVSWTSTTLVPTLTARVQYGDSAGADVVARWQYGSAEADSVESDYFIEAPGTPTTRARSGSTTLASADGQYCLTAATRELNGEWTESEETCADITDDSPPLCGTTGASGSALGVLVALGVASRRRSWRVGA